MKHSWFAHLALTLPLQIDDTHVYDGTEIGECLHHLDVRPTAVWVNV